MCPARGSTSFARAQSTGGRGGGCTSKDSTNLVSVPKTGSTREDRRSCFRSSRFSRFSMRIFSDLAHFTRSLGRGLAVFFSTMGVVEKWSFAVGLEM